MLEKGSGHRVSPIDNRALAQNLLLEEFADVQFKYNTLFSFSSSSYSPATGIRRWSEGLPGGGA